MNFGNPITGYNQEHYSRIIEQQKEINDSYLVIILNNSNHKKNNSNCSLGICIINYSQNGGNKNSCSQISQEGLEMRSKNASRKNPLQKRNVKIKKIKIPKWTFMNKSFFN